MGPPLEKKDRTSAEIEALPIEGLMDAPTIYADGFRGAILTNGVIKLNFFQNLMDTTADAPRRRASLVLTMPLVDFAAATDAMKVLADDLVAQGVIQRAEPAPAKDPQ